MKSIVRLGEGFNAEVEVVGGKGLSLSRLLGAGFKIPESWCILTSAYDEFVTTNNLNARIQMELKRKDLSQCRWEELWDVALRIRNLFIKNQSGAEFMTELKNWYEQFPTETLLAVRSSSTVEDAGANSFAGLHDSYIGISSFSELEQKIRMVWASLWSDAALTYRRELNLRVSSRMAVVIQPVVCGKSSGVCFTRNPMNEEQAIIEAVYGMNQGLVDGIIEPHRWLLSRSGGEILSLNAAPVEQKMVMNGGLCKIDLDADEIASPPLSDEQVSEVFKLSRSAEEFYQQPQDVEFTFSRQSLYLLQSRPITGKVQPDPKKDRKAWDLSLKRSFTNLCELGEKIDVYLSQMGIEGKELLEKDAGQLSDDELAAHFEQCRIALEKWTGIYWETFIPFGHGMRLFGQVYNEIVAPEDPYEFVTLLQIEENIAKKRNNAMQKLARLINNDPQMKAAIAEKDYKRLSEPIIEHIGSLVKNYALPPQLLLLNNQDSFTLNFLQFIAALPEEETNSASTEPAAVAELEAAFLQHFSEGESLEWAKDLVKLGRRSFLLRDDDNVYLQRFKEAFSMCEGEAGSRLLLRAQQPEKKIEDALEKLKKQILTQASEHGQDKEQTIQTSRKRQMVGQPAGAGYSTGIARIISTPQDIFAFRKGEIMVCDAIGPELTFAVPLAAGIVERRGGMLIHGAIIAREYKIPCVTGISDATTVVSNGDRLAIDGYLGLVTILSARKKL